MHRLITVFLLLTSAVVQALPPTWKSDPLVLKSYDRLQFYLELEPQIVDRDSSSWKFRARGMPSWLQMDRLWGDIFGFPPANAVGKHSFTLEVSDDAGRTWVPVSVELEIESRPNLVCPNGDSAALLGSTPEGLYDIFSCKMHNGA